MRRREAQRGYRASPRSHSESTAEPGLDTGSKPGHPPPAILLPVKTKTLSRRPHRSQKRDKSARCWNPAQVIKGTYYSQALDWLPRPGP